ncbi:Apoptotic protease-activating factor 1 [Orchesella cincta]|uniref:Apoptotic protease-activating factor 1 n=1 Tax=Orchesella cincta TaxID=48709 RepID=A0A1D2NBM4_ORCCI|nr:Apoptotic protease-activating factor 1 [Orchesella cincta]
MSLLDEQEIARQITSLLKCRKAIVADLDVHDVMPELLSKFVISHADKQRIDHEKSAEDKADKLLTVLEEKAQKTLNVDIIPAFTQCLQQKYDWLYSRLTEDVTDATPATCFHLESRFQKLLSGGVVSEVFKDDHGRFTTPSGKRIKALLESGGVPCLPAVAVEREEILNDVRQELETLKRNQYLVICGMAGSGKTVLGIQAVSDETLVSSKFQDGVFWLAIGKECSESKDALLSKMRILCDKLGESKAPNSIEHGVDILRTAFMKRSDSLLVLDDVWRAEVIRYFDIGCRTLVTTRDLAVMDVVNGRVKYFQVKEGFNKEESLRLFAQALRIKDPETLPKEAYEIHCQCKGSPMVISLISSLMQDHQIADSGRWAYYLESLSKRKYSKMRKARSYEHESIVDAISLSIESLSDTYRNYYYDFALFQDDVGIPCAVLMTLWNLKRYEVEDIMKDFVRKSMAVEEYDSNKKTYYYSIHDLQLDYLKYQLIADSKCEKDLHERLMNRYIEVCSSEFHKLPDDGYAFFYLGYHIYKSGFHHLFPTIYLDLQFIGEKIRVTGPADLLVDIKKYFDFIVCEREERLKLIEEIQTFAQLEGHKIYGQLDVDIIQIALQAPYLQRVHEQAKKLARASPNRLYIEWTDHVVCAKFVGSGGNHFIAGLHNGTIQLCDLESSAVCHIFFGHTDTVNSIQAMKLNACFRKNGVVQTATEDRLVFLSASADKTCKMWDLQSVLEEVELLSAELKSGRLLGTSPSPKLRPDHWNFEHKRDDSYFTFEFHSASVTNAEFAMDGNRVVSTSLNEIIVWDSSNGSVVFKISPCFDAFPQLTYQLCRVPPEKYPSYLICSAENQLVLLSPQRSTVYSSVEGHTMRIVDLIFLSADRFCSISENDIGIWKVIKNYPKGKTFRSRSLSPSRCVPPSIINGKLELPHKTSNLLQPLDMNLLMTTSITSTDSGGKSPGSKSDCAPSSTNTLVQIDDGNITITAIRDDILPKKGNGNYLCAAIVKNNEKFLLACGTSDHKIAIWELTARKFLGSFTSHNGWVTCLDFSAVDICTLLSGSEDHCVMVWDIEEEERGTKEPQKHSKFTSSFHESGAHKSHFISAFISERNTIQVYRDYKRLFETAQFDFEITATALSPSTSSSCYVVVGTTIGKIYRILFPAFSTSVGGTPEKKIDLDIKQIGTHNLRITLLQIDPSGQFLISGAADGSFMVFMNFMLIRHVSFSHRPICGIHFPFADSIFIVCSQDGNMRMFDAVDSDSPEFQYVRAPGEKHITCTEVSSDGTQVAFGTTEDGIVLFSLDKYVGILCYKILNCHHKSPVRSLAFDAFGTKLAVGHDNGLITIWKGEGEMFYEETDLVLHKSWIRKMRFSPSHVSNSKWLITCGDKLVFWSLEKPEEKHRRTSFMSERRRRRSGESPSKSNNRLSLEIPTGSKIGRQGKRELLQQFSFRGNFAQNFESDLNFTKVITVDDTGVFYVLESMK